MTIPAEFFTPPPADGAPGDAMQSYSRIWRHVQVAVERHADWLANDRDEREELVQAARLELWRIDPSRCDVTNREDVNYLRAILRKRMSTVATASFHGRNARSDVVPLDLVKELKCEEEESAEE